MKKVVLIFVIMGKVTVARISKFLVERIFESALTCDWLNLRKSRERVTSSIDLRWIMDSHISSQGRDWENLHYTQNLQNTPFEPKPSQNFAMAPRQPRKRSHQASESEEENEEQNSQENPLDIMKAANSIVANV